MAKHLIKSSIGNEIQTSFFEYYRDESGTVKNFEIFFLSGNKPILICIIISCIMGAFGASIAVFLWFQFRKRINIWYAEYLGTQRSLAMSKANMKNQGFAEGEGEEKKKKVNTKVLKYLRQGIFSSSIIVDQTAMFNRNTEGGESGDPLDGKQDEG